MAKAEKVLFISVAVIVLAVVVAINWDLLQYLLSKKKPAGTDTNGDAGTTAGNGGTAALNLNRVLKKGVSGAEVAELQKALNKIQPSGALVVDGAFGSKTEAKLYSLTGLKQITLAQGYQMLQSGFQ